MLDTLLAQAADPTAAATLHKIVAAHIATLRASAGRGDRNLVGQAETAVAAEPAGVFRFDSAGHATLTAGGFSWPAGRFETPSIGELRGRAKTTPGDARLWVLDGASPATDIGALQATTAGRPLFQVASQFNCLESPGPYVVRVAEYFNDYTQGPRASVSAFSATLLRHYAAPARDGSRFVQGESGRQIDLLADVFGQEQSPVRGGYLASHGGLGADTVADALVAGFDRIRIGVHDDAPVLLGYDWDGAVDGDRRVAQVFTSTVAGGGYGGQSAFGRAFEPTCRQLLRAAYLGTLLAAIALDRSPVVLTLIGGGVFGNPVGVIWDAILWAFDETQPIAGGLSVVVNGRDLVCRVGSTTILPGVRQRGGAIIRFDREGLVGIDR
ncbi:MAG: hypothetical protein C0467_32660 [Planctomycetaceae bacterium]|nr:hypothetical protein [Planctomycetaceae bacterium]